MDLDKVLHDLHMERQWLETVIRALESVSDSPPDRWMRPPGEERSVGRPGNRRQRREPLRMAKRP